MRGLLGGDTRSNHTLAQVLWSTNCSLLASRKLNTATGSFLILIREHRGPLSQLALSLAVAKPGLGGLLTPVSSSPSCRSNALGGEG